MADTIDWNTAIKEPLNQGVEPLLLAALFGVVVINEQRYGPTGAGCRIDIIKGFIGIFKGEVEVLLTKNSEPFAASQPVLIRTRIAHHLVYDVESVQRVFRTAK